MDEEIIIALAVVAGIYFLAKSNDAVGATTPPAVGGQVSPSSNSTPGAGDGAAALYQAGSNFLSAFL